MRLGDRMNIKLREPEISDEQALKDYIEELSDELDAEGTNRLYIAIKENKYLDWLEWIKLTNSKTFLIVNDNKILGLINIRYKLNDFLKKCGGHIGYNIRPSERRKGYAKEALKLILKNAYENGLDEVLIDCYKDNTASRKTIESTSAELYSEEYLKERKQTLIRYKINLKTYIKDSTNKIR
jgi:predicted acetyltransferase